MIKSDSMASTVSHCENCLYQIKDEFDRKEPSLEQEQLLRDVLDKLEQLYFTLREEE
jgi:hypothetical protein